MMKELVFLGLCTLLAIQLGEAKSAGKENTTNTTIVPVTNKDKDKEIKDKVKEEKDKDKDKDKDKEDKKKKSKEERAKDRENKAKDRVLGRNPKVKAAVDKVKGAKSKADVVDALKKAKGAAKNKSAEMSDYERNAISSSLFKSAKDSKKVNTLELIKGMGSLALSLPVSDYKHLDQPSLFEVLRIGREESDGRKLSIPSQDIIFKSLIKLVKKKDWTKEIGTKLSPLKDVLMNHKFVKKLPTQAIDGILTFLVMGKTTCEGKPPRLIKVLLSQANFKEFTTAVLPRFGDNLCYSSIKQLKSIPPNAITTKVQVEKLCNTKWSPAQVKIVIRLAQKQSSFSNLKSLTCNEMRMFKNCWAGVKTKDFKALNITMDKIDCFNSTVLPNRLKSVLAKNIRDTYGPLNKLGVGEVRKVISAYGADAADLKSLNRSLIKDLAKDIESQIKKGVIKNKLTVKVAAELIVKEKIKDKTFKLSSLPAKLVSEISTTTLMDIPVEKLGFSENDTDTNTETPEDDNKEKSRPLSVDIIVIKKLEKKYGKIENNTQYWRKAIKRVKNFMCGFSPSSVKDMSEDNFYFFVSALKNGGSRCASLVKAVSKRYEKIKASADSQILTEFDFSTIGPFLLDMRYDYLVNTTDDEDTRRVAIGLFKKACSNKIYPEWRLKGLAKIALAMLKIISGTGVTSDTIDTLECLSAYVELKIWKDVPKNVIVEKSEILGKYEFTNDVRKEFVKKIKENHATDGDVTNAMSQITSDQFRKYTDLIVKVLAAEDIEKLKPDVLKDNLDKLATIELPVSVATKVNEKVQKSSRRRRRAVTQDLSTKTATQIIEMGTLMYGLSADDIKTINNDVFKEALGTIGMLSGFSEEQKKAWVAVLKRAYTSLGSLVDSDLKRVKYLILGMSTTEIATLSLKTLEVISVFSSIKGYTTAQKTEVYNGIKKGLSRTNLSDFTGDELSATGQFLTAATTAEITSIQSSNYKTAARGLGEVNGWSTSQLTALKTVAVNAYGNINSWSSAIVNEAGAALAGATSAELNSLSLDSFKSIKPVAIKQIPSATFQNLDTEHLTALTPTQFAAVTTVQKDSLTSAQRDAFNTASGLTETLSVANLITTKCANWPCDSGVERPTSILVVAVIVTFLSIFWTTLF